MIYNQVESLQDVIAWCGFMTEAVDALDSRGPLTPDDRVVAWHHVQATADALAVVLSQMASDAVQAMDQLGIDEGVTDIGPVHLADGYAKEEWKGWQVAGLLGRKMVDRESGELVDAIPVAVVRDVVPGCATADLTSSKWRVTKLRDHLAEWWRYREKHDAPKVIRKGTNPNRR